jgi:hypothetical protein
MHLSSSFNRPLGSATLAALLGLGFIGTSHGTVILTETFESYTAGASLTAGGTWGNSTGGTVVVVRDEATSTAFGTPNQFLDYNDASAGSGRLQSQGFTAASDALTTFAFDFMEPSVGGSNEMWVGYSINNLDLIGANRRMGVTFNGGTIGSVSFPASNTYSLDTTYRFYMIFNDTAAAVSYSGGTLAAGVADMWLEDAGGVFTFVGTRNPENVATSETSYSVAFRSFTTPQQRMFIDNVSLTVGAAAVPEPAVALLGGMGLLALLRRRRD